MEGREVDQLQKFFFWEFTYVYAFDLALWSLHDINLKMIFLTIFVSKNDFFGHYCPKKAKKWFFLNGRPYFIYMQWFDVVRT